MKKDNMSISHHKNDLAFGKPVMESCNHPEYLTNATICYGDNEKKGYLGTHWPNFVTVDLLKIKKVGAISFKLWDWEDPNNKDSDKSKKKDMQYAYRLLVSKDLVNWTILFDCADIKNSINRFKKGWQYFIFNPIKIRYIRIHCLRNKLNSGFHIVKLNAFKNAKIATEIANFTNPIKCHDNIKEIYDGAPLSYKLRNIAGQIQSISSLVNERTEDTSCLEFFSGLDSASLFKKAHEVEAVESKINEIRSLIVEPIMNKIEYEVETGKDDFLVDFCFGMFQFCVVTIMYIVSKKYVPFCFCVIALSFFIIVFLKNFNPPEKNVSKDKPAKPEYIPISSISDSDGNIVDNTIKTKIESKGISVLLQEAFWSPGSDGVNSVNYDEKEGYHGISTPGWIEFDFGEKKDVKYIRFLLWDNNGAGKRVPSHRIYNYRVAFKSQENESWKVLHDTMEHGSSGWQEFVNESGKSWPIRFIRIYGIYNSGHAGHEELWLVRLGISKSDYCADLEHIPRNRIVKYRDVLKAGRENSFVFKSKEIMRVINWLRKRSKSKENWKDYSKAFLQSCNMQFNKKNINVKLKSLFDFDNIFINGKNIDELTEDSARDIHSLVSRTIEPVKKANDMKKQFDECMLKPRIFLVVAATVPIFCDCLCGSIEGENLFGSFLMVAISAVTFFIAEFLVFKILHPDVK